MQIFDLVVAAVLVPLGIGLALTRPAPEDNPSRPARLIPASVLVFLAAAVGCVGGIYGMVETQLAWRKQWWCGS